MLPLIVLESMQDKQTDKLRFIYHPNIGIQMEYTQDRKTDKLNLISSDILESKLNGQTKAHFTPHIIIYSRLTDGQTTFHFTRHTFVLDRQIGNLRFISPLIFG